MTARELEALVAEARGCTRCELYLRGTQTVFGEGPADARVVLVGEQPGDEEDRVGRPFVGPAGRVLDRGLADAGIDRGTCYVTNAVKHFRWEPRGKRRMHMKPGLRHVEACRPWLEAELGAIRPKALVLMGATAAQSLLGRAFRVTRERGKRLEHPLADVVVATVHPSSILRAPDDETRHEAYAAFVADLRVVAEALR